MSIWAKKKTGAVLRWGAVWGRWRRAGVGLALVAVATLWAGAAVAQLERLTPEAAAQWSSVGRVNAAGHKRRAMCSGVLVAPDWVLTAAHCVFWAERRPIKRQDLQFVAGWYRGAAVASAGVAEILIHPQSLREGRFNVVHDLALLRLDRALDVPPLAVMGRDLAPGPYAVVAYQTSRPHAPGGRFDCRFALRQFSLGVSDCMVEPGSSGGPVMARVDGGWAVAGVVSARAKSGGVDVTLVARALDWVAGVLVRQR